MNYDVYKEFLNTKVSIGIPHWFDDTKLFFENGNVLEVTNEYLILKTADGIRKIPISDIMQIEHFKDGDK